MDEEDDIGDYERKRLQNIEERKEKFNNLQLKQLKKSCSNNLKKKSEVSTSNTTNNGNLQGVKLFDTFAKYFTFIFPNTYRGVFRILILWVLSVNKIFI